MRRAQGFERVAHQLRLGRAGPGSPGHVMYVWVDALTTYMTGVGFADDQDS